MCSAGSSSSYSEIPVHNGQHVTQSLEEISAAKQRLHNIKELIWILHNQYNWWILETHNSILSLGFFVCFVVIRLKDVPPGTVNRKTSQHKPDQYSWPEWVTHRPTKDGWCHSSTEVKPKCHRNGRCHLVLVTSFETWDLVLRPHCLHGLQ